MLSSTFHLPTFAPNHLLLNFLPDPSVPDPGLPSPGRGSSFEVKVVVGEGAGHGVWKRVEGERCSAEQKRTQGEVLRGCRHVSSTFSLTLISSRVYRLVWLFHRPALFTSSAPSLYACSIILIYLIIQPLRLKPSPKPSLTHSARIPPRPFLFFHHSYKLTHQLVSFFPIPVPRQTLEEGRHVIRSPTGSGQEQICKPCSGM